MTSRNPGLMRAAMITIAPATLVFSFDSSLAAGDRAHLTNCSRKSEQPPPIWRLLFGRQVPQNRRHSRVEHHRRPSHQRDKRAEYPQEVMREIPRTLNATRVVLAGAITPSTISCTVGRSPSGRRRPCSVHEPSPRGIRYALAACVMSFPTGSNRDGAISRSRAHRGWKGLINDPGLDGG